MPSITKKSDGKYKIRVSRGTGDRRKWINETFEGTLKEARARARELESQADSGQFPRNANFEQTFETWISVSKDRLSPRTLDDYDRCIRRNALDALKHLKLSDVRPIDVETCYASLSPSNARHLHSALRAMFNWAIRKHLISNNPCEHADLPKKPKPQIVTLDPQEAVKLSEICATQPNGVIFELALETGMRPEEYLALRWSDVKDGELIVTRAVQFNTGKGGGFYFKDLKTRGSRRRVPLSEHLQKRLAAHRKAQLEHRIKSKTWHDLDLVFPNKIGRPISLTNLRRRYFAPILEKCGFGKHVTLYSLRHSCATLLLMAGYNPKVVSERLGHSSIVLTLDVYSHVLPHMQDNATEAMARMMRKG
jgi:integrase